MSAPPPYSQQPPLSQQNTGSDRSIAILAHLSAPIAALLSVGTLSLLGPLAMWAIYKDKSSYVRRAAAGAFNFNLSFWVLLVVSLLLTFTVIGAIIGIPLMIVIFVVSLWCHIKGAIRASNGEIYDYPFQIKVLS
ncbi:DUF4870 domain-containing protein [Demetria terragena]|uniref:DUF4870 domain-containing protein n=1 Tax=Demetria terragena TaxID=63959 RepID=UPI00035D3A9A|nr:DUF4870 domain-containing protein [Demetria terragena]